MGSAGGAFQTLHTWTIMTDGEPSGGPDPGPDGGGFFPRWHAVIRGGLYSLLRYELRVTKGASPTGKIRNVRITAARVNK